jgi:uncharacterized membrane protein YdjX (TVP38/TMEM64 family)
VPDSSWGEPRVRCGSRWRPEQLHVSWGAFVPFGWDGGWAIPAWKRFIPLFPPVAANLLAGMAKMPWRIFYFYNLMGSAIYAISYTLIGYVFGKKWKLLQAWFGPTALYLILAGITLIALGVIFRPYLSELLARLFPKKRKRK